MPEQVGRRSKRVDTQRLMSDDELRAEVEQLREDVVELQRLGGMASERNMTRIGELLAEVDRLRAALMALVDALHDATSNGPALVGRAEEKAIRVLARPSNRLVRPKKY